MSTVLRAPKRTNVLPFSSGIRGCVGVLMHLNCAARCALDIIVCELNRRYYAIDVVVHMRHIHRETATSLIFFRSCVCVCARVFGVCSQHIASTCAFYPSDTANVAATAPHPPLAHCAAACALHKTTTTIGAVCVCVCDAHTRSGWSVHTWVLGPNSADAAERHF